MKHMHPSSGLNMSISYLPLLLSLASWLFILMPKMHFFTAKATLQFTFISHLVSKAKCILMPSYFFSNHYTASSKYHVSGTWCFMMRLSILVFYLVNSILVFSFSINRIFSFLSISMIFSWWISKWNAMNSHCNSANNSSTIDMLGINIECMNGIISPNQISYIDRMMKRFWTKSSISTYTSLNHTLSLVKAAFYSKRANDILFKELTGSFNHLAICKCPNTSLAVPMLSQFNQDPTIIYLSATWWILKYA